MFRSFCIDVYTSLTYCVDVYDPMLHLILTTLSYKAFYKMSLKYSQLGGLPSSRLRLCYGVQAQCAGLGK